MNLLILLVIIIIVIAITYYLSSHSAMGAGEDIRLYTGEEWFSEILSGKKTIDVRPGTYERHKDLEGKEVVYFHKDKEVKVKIVRIVHYNTMAELFNKEDPLCIAPHLGTPDKAKESLTSYYTPEKLRDLGGINAFHLSTGKGTEHKASEKKEKKEKSVKSDKKKKGKK